MKELDEKAVTETIQYALDNKPEELDTVLSISASALVHRGIEGVGVVVLYQGHSAATGSQMRQIQRNGHGGSTWREAYREHGQDSGQATVHLSCATQMASYVLTDDPDALVNQKILSSGQVLFYSAY